MTASDDRTGRVRVKICGITNLPDAWEAIEAGADALGFNFWPGSRRFLEQETAAEWLRELPTHITKVAVLVDPTMETIEGLLAQPFINLIQLHGSERAETCRALAERNVAFMKAFPLTAELSARELRDFGTNRIMLDSSSPRGFGGTGEMIDLDLAARFVETHPDFEVVLAGGLTPSNVAKSIERVRPFMVDVASGVESGPGKKDRVAMRDFVAAARAITR